METYNLRAEKSSSKTRIPVTRPQPMVSAEIRRLLLAALDCALAGALIGLAYSLHVGIGLGCITAVVGALWAYLGGFEVYTDRRRQWRKWAGILTGLALMAHSPLLRGLVVRGIAAINS